MDNWWDKLKYGEGIAKALIGVVGDGSYANEGLQREIRRINKIMGPLFELMEVSEETDKYIYYADLLREGYNLGLITSAEEYRVRTWLANYELA